MTTQKGFPVITKFRKPGDSFADLERHPECREWWLEPEFCETHQQRFPCDGHLAERKPRPAPVSQPEHRPHPGPSVPAWWPTKPKVVGPCGAWWNDEAKS